MVPPEHFVGRAGSSRGLGRLGVAWVQWSPEPCTQGPGVPWGWWLGEGGVGTRPRFGSQAQPRCLQPPMGLTWSRAGGPPERRSAWCLEPCLAQGHYEVALALQAWCPWLPSTPPQ